MAAPGREMPSNKITTPELIEKINPKNKELYERFLKNLSTKCSPKTIRTYRSNFNIFFVWNLQHNENKFFVDIKKFELMDFFDKGSVDWNWSPNRYAHVHSTLSSFSDWIMKMYDEKYPQFRNIVKLIDKQIKQNVRKKSIFKKEDFDVLMQWLSDNDKIQEQCLLGLLMASGTRISEVERFTTDIIDLEHTAFEGLFIETTEEIKVKGRGVHGKMIPRYLITNFFKPYYENWLPIRNEIIEKRGAEPHNKIFIKSTGEPATESTFRSWMTKWDEHLPQHFYPHAARHFWTSYLSYIGLEKELIQQLQAWSTDALVDVYNDNTIKDKKWKSLDKLKSALENESPILSENTENNSL
ncbi:site-specific integrase [Clostridium sp. HBUAS56010]|uniref:tyrosine-type recombinase/integrase n=1 Tax=Clostridium sp. HBUAS56010 TaxID=2571127 RepID=UPI001FAAD44E|nr:site-specific integrase [Clostridium sp. HBUAS56010]